MNAIKRFLFLFLALIALCCAAGCRKKLAPLLLTYAPCGEESLSGYLVEASAEGLEIENLLFSATSGGLSPVSNGENAVSEWETAGAITVPQGAQVLWLPDPDSKQSTALLTVTAFDSVGRELTSQQMTFTLSSGSWTVTQEKNVQPKA